MKFIIKNQEELSKKLALNLKATSSNKLVESLKHLKVVIKGNTMENTSYNGESCVISTFSIENESSETTEFLVEASIFKNIIDKFIEFKVPHINVTLDDAKERMYLSYGGIKFNLKILKNTKDFNGAPNLDTYNDYKTVIFNKNQLRRAFSNTQKCTSKDQAKPILEAINILVSEETADVVTLDGYKLALNTITCESSDSFNVSLSSSNSIPILTDILKNGYDFVELNTNGVYTMVENDDTVVFLKQISDKIPNYKKLLQRQENSTKITVNKKMLESALTATKIGNTGNSPTQISINSKDGTVTAKASGSIVAGDVLDNCEIPVPATIHSNNEEELIIGFNNVFLLEILNSIYTENCNLIIQSPIAPFFIENENDNKSTYLLLPIKLNK